MTPDVHSCTGESAVAPDRSGKNDSPTGADGGNNDADLMAELQEELGSEDDQVYEHPVSSSSDEENC